MNVKELAEWLLKNHPHDATVLVVRSGYYGGEEVEFDPDKTQSVEYNSLLLGVN